MSDGTAARALARQYEATPRPITARDLAAVWHALADVQDRLVAAEARPKAGRPPGAKNKRCALGQQAQSIRERAERSITSIRPSSATFAAIRLHGDRRLNRKGA